MSRSEHSELEVVLVEDNPGDVFLVREALNAHGLITRLIVQEDGEAMLRYIERIESGEHACPDIILLDLNLPRHGGKALLERVRTGKLCARVPVLIVSSSDAPEERQITARLGANGYFRKPADFDEFLQLGALVKQLLNGQLG